MQTLICKKGHLSLWNDVSRAVRILSAPLLVGAIRHFSDSSGQNHKKSCTMRQSLYCQQPRFLINILRNMT